LKTRRAAALVLGLLAAAGLAAALAARLAPLPEGAGARREGALRARAAAALERDAGRLAATSRRLAGEAALVEIVEGGSGGVRPGRLFALLAAALPREGGWGAVLLDRNREPVAWAGEPGDLPPLDAPRSGHLAAAFRVTQLTLSHESPVGRSPETRGHLVVTRRFPTGVVRPDLLDAASWSFGATSRRLRVRAATAPGRLLAVDLEPASPRVVEEDVRGAAARPWALAGAAAAALLGLVAGAPAIGAVAARLLLLLAAPGAEAGPFAPVLGGVTGLLSTPVDMALTGLVALLLLRSALASRRDASPRVPLRLVAGAAAVAAAAAPALLGFVAGRSAPSLLLGLGLFTGQTEAPLASAGLVAVSAAALGLAALLAARAGLPGRSALAFGLAGLGLTVGAYFAGHGPGGLALLLSGAVLAAAGLSERVSSFRRSDLLSRAVGIALLVAAGALVTGAGASLGRLFRADERLEAAASRSVLDRERVEEEGPADWEDRVARSELEPWTPAGSLTNVSDLARALWLRGRDGQFPEPGDLLTVRDEEGRVLSSFGTMRPGDEGRGTAVGLRLPVSGTFGVLSRAPWPDGDEEDPLLVEVLGEPAHGDRHVERTDFDGAGRPLGRGRLDRSELSGPLLAVARRSGVAWGTEASVGRRWRATVRGAGEGFVAWGVEVPTPAFAVGSAVAAAGTTLPFALVLLLGGELVLRVRERAARRGVPRARLFGSFRGRLALALLVSGALPLAASAVLVRAALDRSSARAAERHALQLLTEGRRLLEERVSGTPSPAELNRAASVVGVDLLLYRDGVLAAASRAVPVAAGLAPERLAARVAAALGNGASEAAATRGPVRRGGRRVAEAAVTLSREERTTLAVILGEDPAGREAADALVLLAVAVALGALALGGRGALALSRPVEDLVAAAERVGAGEPPGSIEPPETADLARLVEAFGTMSERIRERTELLEREREAAVSVLANLTPAAVLFRGTDGRILFANPAADALLPAGSRVADRLSSPLFAPVAAALRHARPFETRVTLRVDDAEKVLRVVVADLPADAEGTRTVLLLEDLTDFTRAERLETWIEAARAVAHDIKNPLTPIRLTAERLARAAGRGTPPDAGRIAEAAATILRQVDLLTERTARLSRFASPASPEKTLLPGSGVAALIGEVASDFSAHATVRVSCRVEEKLPDVEADRSLLRDAVANFVLNAIEALEERGGTVEIAARATARQPGGGLEISCEDDGPGVSEHDLPRLFDPSFSTKSRGSGMGLAAARRAVEEHGGRLFAERSARGGLLIGFVLPVPAR
jgi:signal transduction histidine kinase